MTDWIRRLESKDSERSDPVKIDYIEVAHQRLAKLSNKLNHPLADLLDWCNHEADLITLGSITEEEARKSVTHYINFLDLYRYEGYEPIGYTPGKPTEKTWVMCINCQHFTPDDIAGGGGAGIGDCAEGVTSNPPCYPKAQRHCAGYQALT